MTSRSIEADGIRKLYSDCLGDTIPVTRLLASIAKHCPNADLKLECEQRCHEVYCVEKRIRDLIVKQLSIPPTELQAIQRGAIHSFNAQGKPDVAALAFAEMNCIIQQLDNELQEMEGRERQQRERIHILEQLVAKNATFELWQDTRTCTNGSTPEEEKEKKQHVSDTTKTKQGYGKLGGSAHSSSCRVKMNAPSTLLLSKPSVSIDVKVHEFASRLKAKAGEESISDLSYCCGDIPILTAGTANFVRNISEMKPLGIDFVNLCRALSMNQDLSRYVTQYDVDLAFINKDQEKAAAIDFGASYGDIASQADEEGDTCESPESEVADIVAAAETELKEYLMKSDPLMPQLMEGGKDASEFVAAQLRDALKMRTDLKAYVSAMSKLGAADLMHRMATVGQVYSQADFKRAMGLYFSLSPTDITEDAFKMVSVCDFKVVLRKARCSADIDTKMKGIRLTLTLLKMLRRADTAQRKGLLQYWRDAQNYCPKSDMVIPWTSRKGHFVDNETLEKGDLNTKNQLISTRILLLQELADVIDPIFKANGVAIENFADLVIHLVPDDIRRECGMFEKDEFYGAEGGVQPQTVVTKMKYLAAQASARKKSLSSLLQFVHLTDSGEERNALYDIFAGTKGILRPFLQNSG